MKSSYKAALDKLIQKKKNEMPTSFSDKALNTIFSTLEYTPQYLTALAKQFDDKSSLNPIIEGKGPDEYTGKFILLVQFLPTS